MNASRLCLLDIKKCSVLCSVPSNIRTGPTDAKKGTYLKKNLNASRLCFLHTKKRSVLCSVPSNIRTTGPTDDAKKGTYYEKSKRNKQEKKKKKNGPRKSDVVGDMMDKGDKEAIAPTRHARPIKTKQRRRIKDPPVRGGKCQNV